MRRDVRAQPVQRQELTLSFMSVGCINRASHHSPLNRVGKGGQGGVGWGELGENRGDAFIASSKAVFPPAT
jgi:hypothetical protein